MNGHTTTRLFIRHNRDGVRTESMRLPHHAASLGAVAFLAFFLHLGPFPFPLGVAGQAEILSITSFQECINVDPSAQNPASGGVGNFLNCSTDTPGTYDTVTIMDLRLEAGSEGAQVFIFDLTTVRPINSSSQSSDNPKGCSPDFADDGSVIPSDCQLTNTTYAIHIDSTEYIYYYDLTYDSTYDIPYCHVVHISDTVTKACNQPTYTGGGSPYQQYTSSCDARVQEIDCAVGSVGVGGNDPAHCEYWMEKFSTENIYKILTGKNSDGSPADNTREYYAAHTVNDCTTDPGTDRCIRTEFSSDILRKRSPPIFNPIPAKPNSWDDYSSQQLGEIFPGAAWTDHKLAIPDPLPFGLEQSAIFNPDNKLQILNCVGTCNANKQNCYNGYGEPGVVASPGVDASLRSNGTVLNAGGVDIGMFALGPSCSVFRAQLLPQVALVVTMSVYDLSDPMTPPTIVITDNIRPGSQESDPLKQIGFEILSVGTLNGVLGPPLGGSFLICGDEKAKFSMDAGGPRTFKMNPNFDLLNPSKGEQHADTTNFFPSMRTQMAPASEVDNVLYNPWENTIEKTVNATGVDTTVYYPSNRYMSYNEVCDVNGGTIDDGSGRTCNPLEYMWYYLPPDQLYTIGRGCNQIGITDDYWNVASKSGQQLVSQFAADVCNSDPFICVPGFQSSVGTQIFQSQNVDTNGVATPVNKTKRFGINAAVTGCQAATAWEIQHITKGDETNALYEYFTASQNPPSNTLNPGVTGFLNEEEEEFSSYGVRFLSKNNMPPNYTPESPNYWFQKESGTEFVGSPRVYYKPTEAAADKFPLSFEMTVYFVGKFIAYGAIVPSGLIDQSGICAPNPNFPSESVFNVSVINTGRTTGDYNMEMNCPPETNVVPQFPVLTFSDVPANSTSPPQTFVLIPSGSENPDGNVGQDACILTLIAVGDVFSILDTQTQDGCKYTVRDINSSLPPTPSYIAPPPTNGTKCKACDFQCFHDRGGLVHCPCFMLIVVPFVLFGVTLVITGGIYLKHRVQFNDQVKEGRKARVDRDQRIHEEMKASMTRSLTPAARLPPATPS
jgi:hypothetical protein